MADITWTTGILDYGALGRNGMMKTSGMTISPDNYDNTTRIAPVTSQGREGRCAIYIPNEDREVVARAIYPEGFK